MDEELIKIRELLKEKYNRARTKETKAKLHAELMENEGKFLKAEQKRRDK